MAQAPRKQEVLRARGKEKAVKRMVFRRLFDFGQRKTIIFLFMFLSARRVEKGNLKGPRMLGRRIQSGLHYKGSILKQLEIVAYLSTCRVGRSKFIRYCPKAHAARKHFQYIP